MSCQLALDRMHVMVGVLVAMHLQMPQVNDEAAKWILMMMMVHGDTTVTDLSGLLRRRVLVHACLFSTMQALFLYGVPTSGSRVIKGKSSLSQSVS